MTNKEVAQAFADGETKGHSLHMYIEGDIIYSYGRHFPAAKRLKNVTGETTYLVTTKRYSMTTSRHMSLIRNALWGKYTEVEDVTA